MEKYTENDTEKNAEKYTENRMAFDGALFRHARGHSRQTGNEIHPYHELLLFAGTDADFITETGRRRACPGMLFFIPKATFHQFDICDQENYERYVLNFPDLPELAPLAAVFAGGVRVWADAPAAVREAFLRLDALSRSSAAEEVRAAYAKALLVGAVYAAHLSPDGALSPAAIPRYTADALAYVGAHLSEKLTVKTVARALGTSESSLSHAFRAALGIPFGRYVAEKRMAQAHLLLSSGTPATVAATLCGYADYSSFYRAYLRAFGAPPCGKSRAER